MNLLAFMHAPAMNLAATNTDIQNYLQPIMLSLIGLAGVVSTFFLITAGISYMGSRGNPEKLEHAKKVLKNALIGLVIVIAAGTITAILSNAYQSGGNNAIENIPSLAPVDTGSSSGGEVTSRTQVRVRSSASMCMQFNTIGSKANDGTLTACVLSGKNEIEKIREQVQNIE